MPKTKPVLLVVLDGWGIRKEREANAIAIAGTPSMDALLREYPSTAIETSGLSVGLPEGQMGNSEVGHVNLGAGRVVYQDLVRINRAVEDGELFRNPVLVDACRKAKAAGADFVKTSTGFGRGGATVEDVALLRAVVGDGVGVKASGGIRTAEDALAMVRAGASRIGASASVALVAGTFRR